MSAEVEKVSKINGRDFSLTEKKAEATEERNPNPKVSPEVEEKDSFCLSLKIPSWTVEAPRATQITILNKNQNFLDQAIGSHKTHNFFNFLFFGCHPKGYALKNHWILRPWVG